ncbi:MAG: AI-2E family transporter [Clostridium sp.]|nr:AI-2E family transporter [Clostridium sp.]
MKTAQGNYWTTDRIMHLILGIALVAIVVILVHYLSKVLLPFLAACFIAYLMQPLVDINMRLLRCKRRALPSILTLLDILLIIGLVIYLFLPSVIKELGTLGAILQDISSGKMQMPPIYKGVADFINKYFDPQSLKQFLSGDHIMALINGGQSILEESIDILVSIISWLLMIVYLLFILIDYPQISRGFKLIAPQKYRPRFMSVFSDVSQSMNHYFRGQGLVAICAMVFYCVGFTIVGLPLAIPMGLLVGILYMIPYFQYVTVIPVAAICLVYSLGGEAQFLPMLGKCGLVYVISQCVCDYVITPHVMGKEMGLNPAVILLSLSIWGSLLGIIGMIIALPLTSLIITYYSRYVSQPAPPPPAPQQGGN